MSKFAKFVLFSLLGMAGIAVVQLLSAGGASAATLRGPSDRAASMRPAVVLSMRPASYSAPEKTRPHPPRTPVSRPLPATQPPTSSHGPNTKQRGSGQPRQADTPAIPAQAPITVCGNNTAIGAESGRSYCGTTA